MGCGGRRAAATLGILILAWTLGTIPAAAQVGMGGFVRLDHYGGVAEERLYSNDRVRLTAVSQVQADDESGFWSAFLELVAHLQYDDEGFSVAPGAVTLRAVDNLVRQAYASFRFDAFDVDVGKKFVRWGKVDFLSPLDVVNHFNSEVPALVDAFEAPLADPLLHVTVYPTDELAVELVYVPFLAPYEIAVDDLDIEFRFGLLDVDMAFRNQTPDPYSELAHSVHGAISYSTFLADLQLSYSWFRDQIPDVDLSGLVERTEVLHEIRGTIVPAYGRAHNIGLGASVGLEWLGDFSRRRRQVPAGQPGRVADRHQESGDPLGAAGGPSVRGRRAADLRYRRGDPPAGAVRRGCVGIGLQPVSDIGRRFAARPRGVPARALALVPDRPPANQLPARAVQHRNHGRVGHQRGRPASRAAGEPTRSPTPGRRPPAQTCGSRSTAPTAPRRACCAGATPRTTCSSKPRSATDPPWLFGQEMALSTAWLA